MGQEERKNKAKMEKTQIQLASTSNDYEQAIKALEETTGRWNRDWKAACDASLVYCIASIVSLINLTEIPRPRRRATGFHEEQLVDICQYRVNCMR